MKKASFVLWFTGLLFSFVLFASLLHFGGPSGCSGGSSGSGGTGGSGGSSGNPATQTTFSSGGVALTANATTSGSTKTVVVADANGNTALTLNLTTTTASLTFPGVSGSTDITFRTPLASLPTDYAARRMAIFVAGTQALNQDTSVAQDNPGCDFFPDTQCTLGCCADHDKCYHDNNCGASSWIPFVGSAACKNCNSVAYDCIGAACVGVTDSFLPNNCYDHRCPVGGTFYDCPPNFNTCDCKDVCPGAPSTCGNGKCESGETAENCFADCGAGNSPSDCCVTTNNCPGETGHSCGNGCCCCGANLACGSSGGVSNICVATP